MEKTHNQYNSTKPMTTFLGGIKVFDPYAQTSALPAKMITRGLQPGPKP
jgi:hypothetical protein